MFFCNAVVSYPQWQISSNIGFLPAFGQNKDKAALWPTASPALSDDREPRGALTQCQRHIEDHVTADSNTVGFVPANFPRSGPFRPVRVRV